MSERKLNAQHKKIILGFIFTCSVLVIIAGCLLIFIIPARKYYMAAPAEDEGSTISTQTKKIIPTEQMKYLDELLSDITITLRFGNDKATLDFNDIKDWLTVEKDGSGYKCIVSDKELYGYTKALADKYDTFESTVTFTAASGEKKTLSNLGTGWIFDSDYAAEMLRSYIEEGSSVDLDLTNKSRESNKWWLRVCADYDAVIKKGDMYAEVSIDAQHMWLHKNGKVILESDVVTGTPGNGQDTPKGAFIVYEKKSPATLYGPGYTTDVSYWMAFIDDVGFHDATWQDSFGGTTYFYNGSHGCVNLPLDFAEKLYKAVYKNMPVYVY